MSGVNKMRWLTLYGWQRIRRLEHYINSCVATNMTCALIECQTSEANLTKIQKLAYYLNKWSWNWFVLIIHLNISIYRAWTLLNQWVNDMQIIPLHIVGQFGWMKCKILALMEFFKHYNNNLFTFCTFYIEFNVWKGN